MHPRQLWFFRLGCWCTVLAAVVHLAGYLSGPHVPANETEQQLIDLASSYQFELPGGGRRSLMEFMNGFSLSFSLLLATMAGMGFIMLRRGGDDAVMMLAAARAAAACSFVLLAISLTHWFFVPTIFIAAMAICFVGAALGRDMKGMKG